MGSSAFDGGFSWVQAYGALAVECLVLESGVDVDEVHVAWFLGSLAECACGSAFEDLAASLVLERDLEYGGDVVVYEWPAGWCLDAPFFLFRDQDWFDFGDGYWCALSLGECLFFCCADFVQLCALDVCVDTDGNCCGCLVGIACLEDEVCGVLLCLCREFFRAEQVVDSAFCSVGVGGCFSRKHIR